MAHLGEYVLLITDRFLNILGDPITFWTSLDVTLRFNEPSSGLFSAPAYSSLREQITVDGARVVVMRHPMSHANSAAGQGQFVIAGPIESYLFERSDDGENAGIGNVTVRFADDLAEIVARLTYPDPAQTPEGQTVDNWQWSGNAELGLRSLINLNAGPGARPERQMYGLALGVVTGVGTDITTKADRMEPLGDVARRMAIAGGELGFRTVQSGSQILLQVYAPEDKSGTVRFSFSLGNIKYLGYEQQSPKSTTAIVGGQGEGADRFLIERTDAVTAAQWGRREVLVSRPGNDALADLQADGDKQLADDAATARLQTNVADSHDQHYGQHYGLGDRVAIEGWPGEQFADVVRTVHIQAWPTAGDVISATVGSQAASSDPVWIQRMRKLNDRIALLERRVKPAVVP